MAYSMWLLAPVAQCGGLGETKHAPRPQLPTAITKSSVKTSIVLKGAVECATACMPPSSLALSKQFGILEDRGSGVVRCLASVRHGPAPCTFAKCVVLQKAAEMFPLKMASSDAVADQPPKSTVR